MIDESNNMQSLESHRFDYYLTFYSNLYEKKLHQSEVNYLWKRKKKKRVTQGKVTASVNAVQGRKQLSHWSVEYFQSQWLDSPRRVHSGSWNPHNLGLSGFIIHIISVNLMSLNIPFTQLKLAAYRSKWSVKFYWLDPFQCLKSTKWVWVCVGIHMCFFELMF